MDPRDEVLDIFDEQFQHIGTARRGEVHERGHWHQTFHCWIVQRTPSGASLLFQRRHETKDTNPGKYDVTCAGHLLAGEGVEAGLRELEEELGVRTSMDNLVKVGTVQDEWEDETIRDREFSHVYVTVRDNELGTYQLQPEEVSGLFAVYIDAALKLFQGDVPYVEARGVERTETGDLAPVSRRIDRSLLVSRPATYYTSIAHAAQRLVDPSR